MKTLKALLYCTKGKELLWFNKKYGDGYKYFMDGRYNRILDGCPDYSLNGKIVAECDFEVEELIYAPNPSEFDRCYFSPREWGYDYQGRYTISNEELLKRSCLTNGELSDYLNTPTNDKKTFCKDTFGYAIHINNLKIFDKPRELSDYATLKRIADDYHIGYYERFESVKVAPQNMQYVYDVNSQNVDKYVLISIRPEWLCKILNGEKTIEVRKKVLKEMLE